MTYDDLRRAHPALFANPADCPIRLATAAEERAAIERAVADRLTAAGAPPEWARTGIVHQDQYMVVLRDAVVFADGTPGTYLRLFERPPEVRGAAILPRHADRLILLRHFRHATRTIHLEVPRGFGESGLSSAETARKELGEEIAGTCDHLTGLGSLLWNSGLSGGVTDLFFAELQAYDDGARSEGIVGIVALTVPEVEAMIASDHINDSFTLACFTRARLAGLI